MLDHPRQAAAAIGGVRHEVHGQLHRLACDDAMPGVGKTDAAGRARGQTQIEERVSRRHDQAQCRIGLRLQGGGQRHADEVTFDGQPLLTLP